MISLDDFDQAKRIASQLNDARRRRINLAHQDRTHVSMYGEELRDYGPPSNIGIAFRKVKDAILELCDKQIEGLEGALRVLGVDPTEK